VALHAEQAIAALRAGKQVLCEKPVALDLARPSRWRPRRATMDGCWDCLLPPALPKLLRAKQLIADGAIGQLLLAEANYHGWLESPSAPG